MIDLADKILWRAKVGLLAVALTLVAGSAALATPGIGTPFDEDVLAGGAAGSTYRNASVVGPGMGLGDGTFEVSVSCEAGDRVLSGWPAGVDGSSTLLQSSAEDPHTWSVRVNKNGRTDDFSAEVLCADL